MKRVLLVDDDLDYIFQQKIMLESLGYQVITAEGRHEAEDLLENGSFDLGIYDLMMESHDSGFILAWKTKQKYPDMPVIIATAVSNETGISFDDEADETESWIKADLYLPKGLRKDQLKAAIDKLLAQ